MSDRIDRMSERERALRGAALRFTTTANDEAELLLMVDEFIGLIFALRKRRGVSTSELADKVAAMVREKL